MRWLLGWQFAAAVVVLTLAMCVGEFIDAYGEGGRRHWAAFVFFVVMTPFWVWMTWHRYKHPRWMTAPSGGRASEPPQ